MRSFWAFKAGHCGGNSRCAGTNNVELEMRTVIIALVALVAGVGGMHSDQQGPLKQLQTAASAVGTQLAEAKAAAEEVTGEVAKLQDTAKALETQLAEARAQVDSGAAEVTRLQESGMAFEAELAEVKARAESSAAEMAKVMDQKVQQVTVLQAKVTELEAALAAAKGNSRTAQ